jgi:hypothetical protein
MDDPMQRARADMLSTSIGGCFRRPRRKIAHYFIPPGSALQPLSVFPSVHQIDCYLFTSCVFVSVLRQSRAIC